MKVCDHLVERFWGQWDFAVSWWSCAMLEGGRLGNEAVSKAAEADLIIFAMQPERDLPISVRQWIETWLPQRADREGALVDLKSHDRKSYDLEECQPAVQRHVYLRNTAHRCGLDYLTSEPQTVSRAIPDSLDSFAARAERVTTVLDQILHTQPTPPGMPLTS